TERAVITFLTDFGLQDDFVGTCHGVIAGIAPDARVIDVTHGIPPQAVLQGALVLRNTVPYLPPGIHLAVVDPGVGGERRAVAVRTGDRRVFVGPDNGLLMLAADALGAEGAWELVDPRFRLAQVSRTFHARDVFAPAAAHIASGVGRVQISATVLAVDRFGNVATNVRPEHLDALGLEPGGRAEIRFALDRYYALVARTFGDAAAGELLVYEDSYGLVTLAISSGDAARLTGAKPGDELRIAVE